MTVEVLTALRDRAQARHGLDELWTQVESRGWFSGARPRVIVQVGAGGDARLVADTVHGLAAFLRARLGVGRVDVLDLEGGDWSPLRTVVVSPDDVVTVTGIAAPRVTLPRALVEAVFLVTVTAVRSDPAARLRGVLCAQADTLGAAGWRAARAARVYEAHRLAGSDLAVACGTAGGRAWWLASRSDVAVDRALADAAGLEPSALPDLRAVVRHELLPVAAPVGDLPRLDHLAAPAWRAAVAGARDRLAAAGRFVLDDARAVRRNIRRVPHAVRRRLPALWRSGGQAA